LFIVKTAVRKEDKIERPANYGPTGVLSFQVFQRVDLVISWLKGILTMRRIVYTCLRRKYSDIRLLFTVLCSEATFDS